MDENIETALIGLIIVFIILALKWLEGSEDTQKTLDSYEEKAKSIYFAVIILPIYRAIKFTEFRILLAYKILSKRMFGK